MCNGLHITINNNGIARDENLEVKCLRFRLQGAFGVQTAPSVSPDDRLLISMTVAVSTSLLVTILARTMQSRAKTSTETKQILETEGSTVIHKPS